MMKIGIDIRLIGKKQTGSEEVFLNLVKNLTHIESENEYFLFTDIIDATAVAEIARQLGVEKKANFKIISLETWNKFSWNFWTLPMHLHKNPVDVYLTQYITPFFVPKKIKIVTIIHDVSFNAYAKFIKFSDLFFLRTLIPLSLHRADKIIAVSRFTKDEIVKYYGTDPAKIEWVHNAVGNTFLELSKKKLTEEDAKKLRKKYNLPEKFILYLGTLQPRKNIPTLIEAYEKLPDETRSHLKLVLAGSRGHNFDPKIDHSLEKYALTQEVPLLGYIPDEDKANLFKLATIFCFPSFYEGFGIPILESFMVKTPVIASNIPPHKEIAELCAVFFNPNDATELSQKLQSLFEDTKSQENLANLGEIQAHKFSWKKTSEDILGILMATGESIDNVGEKK